MRIALPQVRVESVKLAVIRTGGIHMADRLKPQRTLQVRCGCRNIQVGVIGFVYEQFRVRHLQSGCVRSRPKYFMEISASRPSCRASSRMLLTASIRLSVSAPFSTG